MSTQRRQPFDINLYCELQHNCNPFVVRKYDGRYKKCRGCGVAFNFYFNSSFVVAHQEHYVVSGRVKGSRHILTFAGRVRAAEGNMFYHCNVACIKPRYPYFDMADVTVHSAIMCRLTEDNDKFLLSLGIRLYYWTLPLRVATR